jgi:regulator of sigma E protease
MELKNSNTTATKDYLLGVSNWHLDELKPDPLDSLGITPFEPVIAPIIGKLLPNSPAEKAGLKIGDKILDIDGRPIKDWYDLVGVTSSNPGVTLNFNIQRGKDKMILPVTTSYKRNLFLQKQGYLGMAPAFEWPANLLRKNKYGPVTAVTHAWQDVATFTNMNFIILGKMLTGKISLKSLGGPITIFQSAGNALNNGFIAFFGFLAFLSISIGIINIIPIPGLDGGHLLFQLIETIFRRPLPEKALILFYRLGMLFLLVIMVQALVNDMLRL